MKLEYYNAGKTDFEPIYQLNREQILQYEDTASINCEAVLKWIKKKIKKNLTRYRAIVCNGDKAGYLLLVPGEISWELVDFYLFEPFRERGIGSAVLKDCIAKADRKTQELGLYVFSRNRRAVAFYMRRGFQVAENKHSRLRMVRKIDFLSEDNPP